jgi:hypothetical protein
VKSLGVDAGRVVPLAFHVDTWDSLGWKDTLGAPSWSARQRVYAKRAKQKSVFTPAAIVDGGAAFPGTDKKGLQKAVEKALAGAAEVALDAAGAAKDGRITVTVGARAASKEVPEAVKIHVAIVESGVVVEITAGELAGKKLTYDHAVRELVALDFPADAKERKAQEVQLEIRKEWKTENLSVVAFAQDTSTMRVLQAAAGKVK